MTYEEAVREINSRLIFGSTPGLKRMEALLALLGNPEKKLKFIHVAGTNGKGTISAYISSALTAAGYKVGLYTSPYVEDFRERFQINGAMISREELVAEVELLSPVADKIDGIITEFEYITALAFNWFERSDCDIVVLEVGLGGRFDATNVIDTPEMAVIASISLDHTAILGDTVTKIAFEKAGIIKHGGKITLYPLQPDGVEAVVKNAALERGAEFFAVSTDDIAVLSESLYGSEVMYGGLKLSLPFSGMHQVYNAATALRALKKLEGFAISEEALQKGFAAAKMPARMELISKKPLVILDGGHNPGCAEALRNLLEKQLPHKKISAIIGMMKDKDSLKYLSEVAPLFTSVITVTPNNPRSMHAVLLAEEAREFCTNCQSASSMEEAVELAFSNVEDALVVCGSLFLAGEIRALLYKKTEHTVTD